MDEQSQGAYLFLLRHYPSLAQAMAGGAAAPLARHMTSVITSDRILAKLEQANPGEQIYFGNDEFDSDRSPVWRLTGQSEPQFLATVKQSPVIKVSTKPGPNFGKPWILGAEPFNWLMTLVIKWYREHGSEQDQRVAVMFLAVHFYASLVFKYYTRQGGYQPNAMAYAMNSLSDKFTLKQEGTMFKAILATAWRSHEKYAPTLAQGSDDDIFKYFINLRNRLNGMVKSLASHYYSVKNSGAFLNQSRERYDDGEMAERTTDSGRIASLADKLTQSFVGEPPPPNALDLASRMADAPRQNLAIAVNGIRSQEGPLIREAFQLILEVFFEEKKAGPDDLRTRSFLAFAVALYARSNTKDGRIERIKAILDHLLGVYSEQYTRTNREATKGAFRKSVYLYLCLFMQMRS